MTNIDPTPMNTPHLTDGSFSPPTPNPTDSCVTPNGSIFEVRPMEPPRPDGYIWHKRRQTSTPAESNKNISDNKKKTIKHNFEDEEKPLFEDVLNNSIKGFTRQETKEYDAFGEKNDDGSRSEKTIYYDENDQVLAQVCHVRHKDDEFIIIKSSDGEYADRDMDGLIDYVYREE